MSRVPIEQLIAQAMQHYQSGKLPEAEVLFRQIIALRPNESNALNLLGVIRARAEDYPAAIDLLHRAIALDPKNASCQLNLGRVLVRVNRLDKAITHFNRANELKPNNANILTNLGTALRHHGQLAEAEKCFREALVLRPEIAESYLNLAITLAAQNQTDEAVELYHAALAIKPDYAGAHTNLGNTYLLKRDIPSALASYRRAVELAPDLPMLHHNLSQALLISGDFENGWREYEWRVRAVELDLKLSAFPQPLWDGGELNGRWIYIQPEQGLGDFIQFVRYVPLVAQRGGRVILGCFEELVELMESFPGAEKISRHGEPAPEFDVYCPLAGLPMRFNTTLETIPATVPYLHANPQRVQQWKTRVQSVDAPLKIGLAWAGRADHRNDRYRSMRLENLAPLAQVPNAVFFSLQKGDAALQTTSSPTEMKLIDWTSELNTFADTAALIDNLDLVISVDTSVAHVAGAMGKPVWVLLPFNGEWRWLLDREDSPWYPTMRLFRQTILSDWKTPIEKVVALLGEPDATAA